MSQHAEHLKPMAHAPLGAPATAAAPWAAFEAPTAEGTVRLWVPGSVRHAADAAVALQSCAPLLDALDSWFGFAPAWRWCAPGTPSSGVPAHARATWHREASTPATPAGAACRIDAPAGGACRIELPWPLLRQLDAPPVPLAAQLHWSAASATLVLAQMQLDEVELESMEPGGAVLLPYSMSAPWQGWLRAARSDGASDAGLYEVRLSLPRPFDAAQLAGWVSADPGEPEARASLWRCAGDGGSARYLASGALMPWGDGWALHLETLAD